MGGGESPYKLFFFFLKKGKSQYNKMEYYLAIKRNEVVIHAIKCADMK